jgi:NADH-quinone oxidoreductase subunit M
MTPHLLSIITFIPLAGALVLLAFPGKNAPGARGFALFISLLAFGASLLLWQGFDPASAQLQFVERHTWVTALGASYLVGVDGLSLFLILLTTFLTPLVILASYSGIEDKAREYLICMLVLETAMLGTLVAQDLLLFYVFWEAMLIPMYFLIGIFGGKNRIYATIKFFIFTMSGSMLMLVAIIYLYLHTPGRTFELAMMTKHGLPLETQRWLFLAFALAFAIKVPMFPLHTWLPDAHVEAPTGGSVILAGVMLKMGTYGFLRFAMPLFPRAAFQFLPLIATLAVVGIVYGALVAMVQKDIKKVVAYSSVSHLGFVMLGVAAMSTAAVSGAVYQMLNHGISTGALFLLVGVIYERRHTRQIKDFGGLASIMPVYAAIFLIVGLSSIGLPGLNGFVGEFMIMAGTIKSQFIGGLLPFGGPGAFYVLMAGLGVIFAAVYILWMYQRVFFGPVTHPENNGMKDLSSRELLIFAPLLALIVVMGVAPRIFLVPMEASLQRIVSDFQVANGVGPSAPQPGRAAAPGQIRPVDAPLRLMNAPPRQPPPSLQPRPAPVKDR